MRLKDYLQQKNLTAENFARQLGIPGASLRSYATGLYRPSPERAHQIVTATEGAVTEFAALAKSWDGKPRVRKQRQGEGKGRRGFVPTLQSEWETFAARRAGHPPASAPLSQALFLLGGRAAYSPRWQQYTLDQVPVRPRQIVEAANQVLQRLHRRPLAFPGLAVAPENNRG